MSHLPTWMEGLTPELEKIAEEELNETPERRQEAVKELRRRINAEADFRPQIDDTFLLRFLRGKKFDVGKAFTTLRNYYIFKARYSGLLTDFTPSDVAPIYEMNNMLLLPMRHSSGAVVGVCRIAHFDIDQFTPEQIFASALVGLEAILQLEATQVCGYMLVMDLSKINLRIMKHYASPTLLYRCVRMVQDCVPCRIKAVHVIHEPFYVSIVYTIVKTFLSEKLKKRFFFHGNNIKSLHQHVPADILPSEFGGKIGPLSTHVKDCMSKITSREGSYKRLNKYGFLDKKIQFLKKQDSRTVFSLFT